MTKAIIFDFDGVIHDTFDLGYSTHKELDPNITKEEYKDIFMGNLYSHKKINPKNTAQFFEIAEKKYSGLKIEENIRKNLIKLRKRFKLFIITSTKESILKKYFHENNLKDLFTEILGFETHTLKTYKFDLILKKYNLIKEECIFVTDTLGDIIEANKVGIKTIAVNFGFHNEETLKKGKPYKIISSFDDIINLVK